MAKGAGGEASISDTPGEVSGTQSVIDSALSNAQPYYVGHPAAGATESGGEAEEGAVAAGPDNDSDELKGELSEGEGEKANPEADQPKKFKYKSHEEAEKGAREATKLIHATKAELKAEREKNAAIEAQLQEVKGMIANLQEGAKPKESAAEKAEEKPQLSKGETRKRVSEALQKVNQLDVDDPEYYDKVAELWVEAGFGAQGGADQQALEKLVAEKVSQAVEAKRAEDKAQQETINSEQAAINYANKVATKLGLDMTPGSPDHKLFWKFKDEAPTGIPFDDQVAYVVKEVRSLRGPVTEAIKNKAEEAQNNNRVLGRGSSNVDITPRQQQQQSARPISLSEALEANQRRV